jgi:hypothetical protein
MHIHDLEIVTNEVEAGAEIAHPPMELPGHGTFAIVIQGGIHHGLWQVGAEPPLLLAGLPPEPVRQG